MKIKPIWPKLVDNIGDAVRHYPYQTQEFAINEIFNFVDDIIKFANSPKIHSDRLMDMFLSKLKMNLDILFNSIDNRVDLFSPSDILVILNSILKCLTFVLDKAIETEEYEFAENLKKIREFIIFYNI